MEYCAQCWPALWLRLRHYFYHSQNLHWPALWLQHRAYLDQREYGHSGEVRPPPLLLHCKHVAQGSDKLRAAAQGLLLMRWDES
jgi:hypothetical protein